MGLRLEIRISGNRKKVGDETENKVEDGEGMGITGEDGNGMGSGWSWRRDR